MIHFTFGTELDEINIYVHDNLVYKCKISSIDDILHLRNDLKAELGYINNIGKIAKIDKQHELAYLRNLITLRPSATMDSNIQERERILRRINQLSTSVEHRKPVNMMQAQTVESEERKNA